MLADRARGRQAPLPIERVQRPSLLRILDAVAPSPAVILGRRCDVLAWNPAGAALDQVVAAWPPRERNVARRVLLDPTARELYPEWESLAEEVADVLRLERGTFAEDARLQLAGRRAAGAIGDLQGALGAERGSRRRSERKVLEHPDVGRLELDYEAFTLPADPGTAADRLHGRSAGPTAARLRRLASMGSPPPPALPPSAERAAPRSGSRPSPLFTTTSHARAAVVVILSAVQSRRWSRA